MNLLLSCNSGNGYSKEGYSNQKSGGGQNNTTVYVRGFDKFLGEDEVMSGKLEFYYVIFIAILKY